MTTISLNLRHFKGAAKLRFSSYASDRSTALLLIDPVTAAPLATASVCIHGETLLPGEVCIKSWSENEGMADALQSAGVIGPRKRTVLTGYVAATVHDLLVPRS